MAESRYFIMKWSMETASNTIAQGNYHCEVLNGQFPNRKETCDSIEKATGQKGNIVLEFILEVNKTDFEEYKR